MRSLWSFVVTGLVHHAISTPAFGQDITLPTAEGTHALVQDGPLIAVTADHIWLDGQPLSNLTAYALPERDADWRETKLLPLHPRLVEQSLTRNGRTVRLQVDAQAPALIVRQVLNTLAQTPYTAVQLVVADETGARSALQIDLNADTSSGLLFVGVVNMGFDILSPGGVSPELKPSDTIACAKTPCAPDGYRYDELSRIAKLVADASPTERALVFSAEDQTPYTVLARTLAATAGMYPTMTSVEVDMRRWDRPTREDQLRDAVAASMGLILSDGDAPVVHAVLSETPPQQIDLSTDEHPFVAPLRACYANASAPMQPLTLDVTTSVLGEISAVSIHTRDDVVSPPTALVDCIWRSLMFTPSPTPDADFNVVAHTYHITGR